MGTPPTLTPISSPRDLKPKRVKRVRTAKVPKMRKEPVQLEEPQPKVKARKMAPTLKVTTEMPPMTKMSKNRKVKAVKKTTLAMNRKLKAVKKTTLAMNRKLKKRVVRTNKKMQKRRSKTRTKKRKTVSKKRAAKQKMVAKKRAAKEMSKKLKVVTKTKKTRRKRARTNRQHLVQ